MLLKSFLSIIMILSTSFCCSYQCEGGSAYQFPSYDEIVSYSLEGVNGIEANRVYLKNDHVYVEENGIIFILNQDEYATTFSPDAAGRYKLSRCSSCGHKYYIKCKNEDCPLNKNSETDEANENDSDE